jgi:hypothetical protein
MEYIKPTSDYNFKEDSCYKTIVKNSGIEDPYLEDLIKKYHFQIDVVLKETSILEYTCEKFTFNNYDEVCEFFEDVVKINYFFIYSYSNFEITAVVLPIETPNIKGLEDFRKIKKREKRLRELNIYSYMNP